MGGGALSDKPQWHPEAALAALFVLSILFAGAGVVNLLGIVEVELGLFADAITSRLGNVLWVTTSLCCAVLFGSLLRHRWTKR